MSSRVPWRSGSAAIVHGLRAAVHPSSTQGLPVLREAPCYNPAPMSVMDRFARRFRFLTLLRASLLLGAVYDLGFAALMVAAPELPARWFDLPLPPLPRGAFYLWVMAVLLAMLACFYSLAARDTRRY